MPLISLWFKNYIQLSLSALQRNKMQNCCRCLAMITTTRVGEGKIMSTKLTVIAFCSSRSRISRLQKHGLSWMICTRHSDLRAIPETRVIMMGYSRFNKDFHPGRFGLLLLWHGLASRYRWWTDVTIGRINCPVKLSGPYRVLVSKVAGQSGFNSLHKIRMAMCLTRSSA